MNYIYNEKHRILNLINIILAAGSSTRMSQNKQLLNYNNKSFVRDIAEKSNALNPHKTICVLGPIIDPIKNELQDLDVDYVINDRHLQGMSSSITSALNTIPNLNFYDAVLIMLCDQPRIPTEHYHDIINEATNIDHLIVSSAYENNFGVPALFKRELFSELLSLNSITGAKSIIVKYRDKTSFIQCDAAAQDIDTDEDYEKLLEL